MPRIRGNQVAGKQVEFVVAVIANVDVLTHRKYLTGTVLVPVQRAVRQIKRTASLSDNRLSIRSASSRYAATIQVFDLLANDPRRHRIDIEPHDVATDAIGFDQRRAAAHEWIGDH